MDEKPHATDGLQVLPFCIVYIINSGINLFKQSSWIIKHFILQERSSQDIQCTCISYKICWYVYLFQLPWDIIVHRFQVPRKRSCLHVLIPQPLKAVRLLFSPMVSEWVVGQLCGCCEKIYPGCISETIRCRMLIVGMDIGWGCGYTTSWCDLELTFDLTVVTLSLKIISGLYLNMVRCRMLILGMDIGWAV